MTAALSAVASDGSSYVAMDGSNQVPSTWDVPDMDAFQAAQRSFSPELAAAAERAGMIPPVTIYIKKSLGRREAVGSAEALRHLQVARQQLRQMLANDLAELAASIEDARMNASQWEVVIPIAGHLIGSQGICPASRARTSPERFATGAGIRAREPSHERAGRPSHAFGLQRPTRLGVTSPDS